MASEPSCCTATLTLKFLAPILLRPACCPTADWSGTRATLRARRWRQQRPATAAAVPTASLVAFGFSALLLLFAAVLAAYAWQRMRRPSKPPTVVVLGASFAGLQAALDLQHFANVVVVDRLSYFEASNAACHTQFLEHGARARLNTRHANWRARREPVESLWRREPVESLPRACRPPIDRLSRAYREPIESLSRAYRESIDRLSRAYREPTESL